MAVHGDVFLSFELLAFPSVRSFTMSLPWPIALKASMSALREKHFHISLLLAALCLCCRVSHCFGVDPLFILVLEGGSLHHTTDNCYFRIFWDQV